MAEPPKDKQLLQARWNDEAQRKRWNDLIDKYGINASIVTRYLWEAWMEYTERHAGPPEFPIEITPKKFILNEPPGNYPEPPPTTPGRK